MNKEDIKILVVDDEQKHLNKVVKSLQYLGYSRIKTRDNGRNIVALARSYMPHLILMDTLMPRVSGDNICRDIKGTEYGKEIGIIGMSSENFHQRWFNAGADDFMNKKDVFNNRHLLEQKIEQVLIKYQ